MCRALIFAAQMVWFGLAIAIPMYDNDRFEGDSCTLADGVTSGTCRRDVDCDYLKSAPKKDWKRCSFDKNVSIVCCHDKSPSVLQGSPNLLRSGFISERMCDGFPLFPEANNHILHGTLADINDFPYLGALAFQDENEVTFRCGANLISREYVLTAAHCLTVEKPTFVRLGAVRIFDNNDTTDKPVDVGIEKVIMHPNYRKRPLSNDIALLKLNRTVDEEFLTPACLYTNSTDPAPNVRLSIAGWGTNESIDSQMSPDLMKAHVTTFERDECNFTLLQDKTPRNKIQQLNGDQLCALGRNSTGDNTGDTCVGDSGGPLELAIDRRRYIVGLTSTGKICGTKFPGIYTRVSHFIDWIESVVWPA
ncbi:serine protease Hayan-like [Ochlerotatus camptorhynchus]|uniref:serine protease Hayan-like n=1 Tax=Ochlerotatus camptorhynchus TaxID=644619 RepID=UPI0031DEC0C4